MAVPDTIFGVNSDSVQKILESCANEPKLQARLFIALHYFADKLSKSPTRVSTSRDTSPVYDLSTNSPSQNRPVRSKINRFVTGKRTSEVDKAGADEDKLSKSPTHVFTSSGTSPIYDLSTNSPPQNRPVRSKINRFVTGKRTPEVDKAGADEDQIWRARRAELEALWQARRAELKALRKEAQRLAQELYVEYIATSRWKFHQLQEYIRELKWMGAFKAAMKVVVSAAAEKAAETAEKKVAAERVAAEKAEAAKEAAAEKAAEKAETAKKVAAERTAAKEAAAKRAAAEKAAAEAAGKAAAEPAEMEAPEAAEEAKKKGKRKGKGACDQPRGPNGRFVAASQIPTSVPEEAAEAAGPAEGDKYARMEPLSQADKDWLARGKGYLSAGAEGVLKTQRQIQYYFRNLDAYMESRMVSLPEERGPEGHPLRKERGLPLQEIASWNRMALLSPKEILRIVEMDEHFTVNYGQGETYGKLDAITLRPSGYNARGKQYCSCGLHESACAFPGDMSPPGPLEKLESYEGQHVAYTLHGHYVDPEEED